MIKFLFNNLYRILTFFFLFIFIFASLSRMNHNDFAYYGYAATEGKLYQDINTSYFPGSYLINKFLFHISPDNYEYLVMRLTSILFYILSIIALQLFLNNKKQKLLFIFLCVFFASFISFEIGSNTSAFFFFIISYIFFFEKKNNKISFFLGSLFLGICISIRSSYIIICLPLLILLIRKNNFKDLILYSFFGGLIGLSPVIFYLFAYFDDFIFWTIEAHNLHIKAYKFTSTKNYLLDLFIHFKKYYYPIIILFSIYFFNLLKDKLYIKKKYQLLILFFLFLSNIITLNVHKQYFEPFIIMLIFFCFKTINFNKNKTIFYSILIFGFFHYLWDNRLLDLKRLNLEYNYFSVQDVRFFLKKNFLKSKCKIKTRTAATVFIPDNFVQHKHNSHGIWFERLKPYPNIVEHYVKYADNTLFTSDYSKNEFNSILVGYYKNGSLDKKLIQYAKSKNWIKYSYKGLDFYIDEKCI